jgi:hypothetical protein
MSDSEGKSSDLITRLMDTMANDRRTILQIHKIVKFALGPGITAPMQHNALIAIQTVITKKQTDQPPQNQ